MSETTLSFQHRFNPATRPGLKPLLLLHGTGGDENDLLPLGEAVAPGAALLAPRGQVLERGAPRFFRRLAEGVFDEDDLRRRTADLASFVSEARAAYGLPAPVALGFSNGANIAASLLLLYPGVLAGAVLLRAMPPFARPPQTELPGTPILLLSGDSDPVIPAESASRLAAILRRAGGSVQHDVLSAAHQLTRQEIPRMISWLDTLPIAAAAKAAATI